MTLQYEKSIFFNGRLYADAVVFSESRLSENGERALEETFSDGLVAAAALRATPYECAYYCDPVTLETDFAHNAAFAVKTEALAAVGGADRRYGVYAATELIARLKTKGLKTIYCPRADVRVASTLTPPYADRLFDGAALRKRLGTKADRKAAFIMKLKALKHPEAYDISRREWLRRETKSVFRAPISALCSASLSFESDAEAGLSRGEYRTREISKTPLVSVITRTRNRPETLRKTLESLRHQTYGNFEVVVVEDGEPLCKKMIESDFSDLKITYKATVKNIGRAAAANLGFSLARGEYLNLLDDDDYLLPEHIELGVKRALAEKADVVFLKGIALEINKLNDAPYRIEVINKNRLDFPRVEPFTMVRRCVTTQNGVLFKKALCEKVGGMREELGAHEDWNLFLRLMAGGSYTTLDYATCCYIVPADKEAERKRLEGYSKFDGELLKDEKLVFSVTKEELIAYHDSVTDDYKYLLSLGLAEENLKKEADKRRELYGDGKLLSFEELNEKDFPILLSGEKLRQLYYSETDKLLKNKAGGGLSEYLSKRAAGLSL